MSNIHVFDVNLIITKYKINFQYFSIYMQTTQEFIHRITAHFYIYSTLLSKYFQYHS